jgi:hypothetical protein
VNRSIPRLTTVMGVARALLVTIGPRETVEVLVEEFGWDATFQALAMLRGDDAQRAFGISWEHLIQRSLQEQIDGDRAGDHNRTS